MTGLDVIHELPDPRTGELLEPTPDNAARVRQAASEVVNAMRDIQHVCDSVLADEAQRIGTKTLHLQDHVVVVSGGDTRVWDPIELRQNLRSVGCPEERIDQLVVEVITWKVNHSVRRQLAGANEAYASAIELASHVEEKPWRATVK